MLGECGVTGRGESTMEISNRVTSLPCTTCSPQCLQERSSTSPRNCCVLIAHCTFCTETPNDHQVTRRAATVRRFVLFQRSSWWWQWAVVVVVVVEWGLVVVVVGASTPRLRLTRARVGHEIVEGPGHDRRRGVGAVAALFDDAEHDVLRVRGRSEADEPGVGLVTAPPLLAVPVLPAMGKVASEKLMLAWNGA